MTIKITQLGNLTGIYGNTILPVVANVGGVLTTVKGNLSQLGTWINQAEIPYGNIIPFADAVYSLGTASYRFKDLYLLGSTIYLGNATISVSNAAIESSLPITASSVNASNLNVTGTISVNSISVTDSVSVSNISATGSVTASDLTTTGTVTAATVTASDVTTGTVNATDVATSNVTATGEITSPSLTVLGNTISLGSATLDVSSGSLESSIPIVAPITSTSNLTLQGAAINFAQGSYIDESEVVGQPGTYGLTLNSPDDGIVGMNALDANATITSSVIVSNVAVQLNVANIDPLTGNVNVWYFDSIGGVFFPDGTRQDTAVDATTLYSNVDVAAYLTSENIASYSNVDVQTYLTNSWAGTIAGNTLMTGAFGVSNVFVPTAANSTGIAGTIVWDNDYLYVCVDTDTWKRANIATW